MYRPFSSWQSHFVTPVENPPFEDIPPRNLMFPVLWGAPKMCALVDTVHRNTGAQLELIAGTALATMAASVQGHADVELYAPTKTPTSLSIYGIGASGSGKTTVENLITKPIKIAEIRAKKECEDFESQYKCKLEIHNAKKQELKKKLRKIAGKEGNTEGTERELLDLAKQEPKRPPRPQCIIESSTALGLRQGIYDNPLSLFQLSSEGGNALSSGALSDFPLQNAAWGGEYISRDTATTGNQTICSPRLTSLILVQKEIHQKHFDKNDGLARSSGFQARALTANYDQGMQRYSTDAEPDNSGLEPFYSRVTELIENTLDQIKIGDKEENRILLKFTSQAKSSILGTRNALINYTCSGGIYELAKDHAAKVPENIARVAAVIHYFEQFEGDISYKTVQLAKLIVFWHSFKFLSHFMARPQLELDAEGLDKWFTQRIRFFGFRYIKANRVQQYGPNGLRKKSVLRESIETLKTYGKISEIVFQRANGKPVSVIDTFPHTEADNTRLYNEIEIQPRFYDF